MSKENYFSIIWRLTVLVLPWQTRWFADASLGGWPWEQGRWSVYASMLLIVAAIAAGTDWKSLKKKTRDWRLGALAMLIALTFVVTLSRVATAQWWVEILLLAFFVRTVRRNGVSRESMMTCFALSLIPHAALAVGQYFTGNVVGSKWFGMAAHAAEDLGASVVQHGDVRLLRAYGGFPHPNILGAWMAVGVLSVLELASRALDKWRALAWSAIAALFSMTLVVTYSREAWIGATLGIIVLVGANLVFARYGRSDGAITRIAPTKQFLLIALLFVVLIGGAVAFSQREHVLSRADLGQRLEAKSVDARKQSLLDGWNVFRAHPFFGTGPNAELLAAPSARDPHTLAPLEPPHDIPLLMLADLGFVGVLLLLLVLLSQRLRLRRDDLPFILVLLPIFLLDHFLWSTWSGLCLGALVFFMTAASFQQPTLDKRVNSL